MVESPLSLQLIVDLNPIQNEGDFLGTRAPLGIARVKKNHEKFQIAKHALSCVFLYPDT